MNLIDTHTHLDSFARSGELAAALARARAADVTAMIAIGTEPEDWTLYRDLASGRTDEICFTVGLHPCSVGEDWEKAVARIEAFWRADAALRPVGLGECGLDRFHLPKEAAEAEKILGWQRGAFAVQLEIARKLGCPLVVHSRGAFSECVEMIDASGLDWARVVFHCFVEGEAEMTELVRRGGRGSFTGILTYKNADAVRAAAQAQGLGRLMLETDAPYLTPMPHRGKPNEPAFLRHTAEYAAGLFGISLDELAAVTTANAKAFFQI
ncbi:MAG TPA: TatD family hydrolase [Opitutaceae bacterium]|jgi:TatD DNase family protein|nr:TatD family hydrolase [Opitutaceae bacterium]